jgi:hypothetical protein
MKTSIVAFDVFKRKFANLQIITKLVGDIRMIGSINKASKKIKWKHCGMDLTS